MFTKKYSDLLLKEKIFRSGVQLSLRGETGRFTHTHMLNPTDNIYPYWTVMEGLLWTNFYFGFSSSLSRDRNMCCRPTFILQHITYLKHFKSWFVLSFIMTDSCIDMFSMLWGKNTQTAYVPPLWGQLNTVLKESKVITSSWGSTSWYKDASILFCSFIHST